MTPPPINVGSREWWTRPSVVLPVVAMVVILVALVTPQASSGRFGDQRLSSHLAGSLGARVFADMSRKLGWRVVQRDSLPAPVRGDGRTIHAVLAPVMPVTPSEAHLYLDAVRAGDALLLVLDGRAPLSDSLGVTNFTRGGILPRYEAGSGDCAGRLDFTPPLWADGRVHLFGLRWLRPPPAPRVVFASLEHDDAGGAAQPGDAAAGFRLGKGRVIVVADPDLLRNDVLRRCAWGADVIAVRMLEWLRASEDAPRTTLAFDEYHQGFGGRPGLFTVTGAFLANHPLGRAIMLSVVAALVLLLAVARRPIQPQHVERIERRDPLEQVDALAHAYEQVHATRTITSRLLRGVRWRVERGGTSARARPDEAFLDAVLARDAALGDDVALVRHALREQVADRDLPEIGAALRRIEHTLTTTAS